MHADTTAERFRFGRNWRNYVETVDEDRIEKAEASLRILGDLEGKSFLDAGCGSGLFSLAATRLGANVTAFDYDPDSVAAARELQQRTGAVWPLERGDILSLGDEQYDVVYSWGVIHHTGAMWRALDNLCRAVKPGGQLYIAVYNDQGQASKLWRVVKRAYNRVPPLRPLLIAASFVYLTGWNVWASLPHLPRFGQERGMNVYHDLIDWVGGYPFEVASVSEVFAFCRERGFNLRWLNDAGTGHGCNEFLFER